MKTQYSNSLEKRTYAPPSVELITLDNEISLQLESSPTPGDHDDEVLNSPNYFNNDPYKTSKA